MSSSQPTTEDRDLKLFRTSQIASRPRSACQSGSCRNPNGRAVTWWEVRHLWLPASEVGGALIGNDNRHLRWLGRDWMRRYREEHKQNSPPSTLRSTDQTASRSRGSRSKTLKGSQESAILTKLIPNCPTPRPLRRFPGSRSVSGGTRHRGGETKPARDRPGRAHCDQSVLGTVRRGEPVER